MAHVTKTPNGKWECRWSFKDSDDKRHFQKRRFRTKAEAEQHRRTIEDRNATRQSVDQNPGRTPLKVWAEEWMVALQQGNTNKPSTLRGYQRILDKTVLPELGHRQVGSITTADVRRFVNTLSASGKAAPTVRHHYGVLRLVLAFAAEDGAIALNPAQGFRGLPSDRSTGRIAPQPQALTEQQVAKLAERLDATPPYGLMIRFMAYTGLRAGEVAGLDIGDLDLLRRTVTVQRTRTKVKATTDDPVGWEVHTPKNGKSRKVPLPQWLCDDLAAYLAEHPYRLDRDHPLFPGRTANDAARFQHATGSIDYGKPWERDAFYKRQFKPALNATGLPANTRLHDLRHTAGTIMLSNGIPPYRVAAILGHSLQVLTSTYAHVLDTDSERDMERLSRPSLEKNA